MATFAEGDRVDWGYGEEDPNVGPGPFTVRGVERDEPDDDGHCQWVALRKEVDGQLFCWASYRGKHGKWIPDHDGPPYIAAPPEFSNTHFLKIT